MSKLLKNKVTTNINASIAFEPINQKTAQALYFLKGSVWVNTPQELMPQHRVRVFMGTTASVKGFAVVGFADNANTSGTLFSADNVNALVEGLAQKMASDRPLAVSSYNVLIRNVVLKTMSNTEKQKVILKAFCDVLEGKASARLMVVNRYQLGAVPVIRIDGAGDAPAKPTRVKAQPQAVL